MVSRFSRSFQGLAVFYGEVKSHSRTDRVAIGRGASSSQRLQHAFAKQARRKVSPLILVEPIDSPRPLCGLGWWSPRWVALPGTRNARVSETRSHRGRQADARISVPGGGAASFALPSSQRQGDPHVHGRIPTSAKGAPWGSIPLITHSSPGTSCGPLITFPPAASTRFTAASISTTRK